MSSYGFKHNFQKEEGRNISIVKSRQMTQKEQVGPPRFLIPVLESTYKNTFKQKNPSTISPVKDLVVLIMCNILQTSIYPFYKSNDCLISLAIINEIILNIHHQKLRDSNMLIENLYFTNQYSSLFKLKNKLHFPFLN